jgi:hypothetical protein
LPQDATKESKPLERGFPLEQIVAESVGLSDLEFTETGLLIRNSTKKEDRSESDGWLLLLERFAWVEKIASEARTELSTGLEVS